MHGNVTIRAGLRRYRLTLAVIFGAAALFVFTQAYTSQIVYRLSQVEIPPAWHPVIASARRHLPDCESFYPSSVSFDGKRGMFNVCGPDGLGSTKLEEVTAIDGHMIPYAIDWHEYRDKLTFAIHMLVDNQTFICSIYYEFGHKKLSPAEREKTETRYIDLMRHILADRTLQDK